MVQPIERRLILGFTVWTSVLEFDSGGMPSFVTWRQYFRSNVQPRCVCRNDSEGRRLFRHARSKLSVDQFEQFLDNVRRLNAHAVTVEESLSEAEKICGNLGVRCMEQVDLSFCTAGYEHPAIFEEFRNLLLRKGKLWRTQISNPKLESSGHAANHNNSSTLMGSPLSHC